MPKDAVYVGRPTKWGNPYIAGVAPVGLTAPVRDAADAVARYRIFLADLASFGLPLPIAELRGKNLACWCPLTDANGNPVPCHADVLLEIANAR